MRPDHLLALTGGALVAVQLAMNGQTRLALGHPLWAALANNLAGLLGLTLALLLSGARWPGLAGLQAVPPLHWGAGLLGAGFIAISALTAPRLGLAALMVLTLCGQLLTSLLIDHLGGFGAPPRSVDLSRLGGLALVLAGTLLIAGKS